MKRIIVVGAGQMSRMAKKLIRETEYDVIGFADNNPALHGTKIDGLPVMSVQQAISLNPQGMLIAVMGEMRGRELYMQLRDQGYGGAIRALHNYAQDIDIRGAVLMHLAERIGDILGDLAELGVYRGELASKMNRLFPDRTLHLFDTFEGFDARDVAQEKNSGYSHAAQGDFADTSEELVKSILPYPQRSVFHRGYFPETARGLEDVRYALVSLDADLYEPTLEGLRYFYPRLSRGGVILLHDYHNARFSGVRAAVDDYEREAGRMLLLPVADLHGSVMIIRP